jgi:hypothetical protein
MESMRARQRPSNSPQGVHGSQSRSHHRSKPFARLVSAIRASRFYTSKPLVEADDCFIQLFEMQFGTKSFQKRTPASDKWALIEVRRKALGLHRAWTVLIYVQPTLAVVSSEQKLIGIVRPVEAVKWAASLHEVPKLA